MKVCTAIVIAMVSCFFMVHKVASFRCVPCEDYKCPKPPSCTPDRSLVDDICNCCKVCGKALLESCGGLWTMHGRCSFDYVCHKVDPNDRDSVGVCLRVSTCHTLYGILKICFKSDLSICSEIIRRRSPQYSKFLLFRHHG